MVRTKHTPNSKETQMSLDIYHSVMFRLGFQLKLLIKTGAILSVLICSVLPSRGQTDRATVTGTVTDPSGGVVPDAVIEIFPPLASAGPRRPRLGVYTTSRLFRSAFIVWRSLRLDSHTYISIR
jgi:hypothetical protein